MWCTRTWCEYAKYRANHAHPRLAHVVMHISDVVRSIEFYMKVLDLRLSDESGGVVAFLHGVHGSDHHMIAFAQSNSTAARRWPGRHADGRARSTAGCGLGRHVLGSKYFHYARDPRGSDAKCSADMDFNSANASRKLTRQTASVQEIGSRRKARLLSNRRSGSSSRSDGAKNRHCPGQRSNRSAGFCRLQNCDSAWPSSLKVQIGNLPNRRN